MANALLRTSVVNIADLDRDSCTDIIKLQNCHVSYHMTFYLLKEAGIRLNGYTAGNVHSSSRRVNGLLRDKSFKEAIETLETSCRQMRGKYQREIAGLVNTLDISDTQLYSNFQQAAGELIDHDLKWGRIAVLLFFASVLAERLYNEGHYQKITSLIEWLSTYLNENASTWILEKGGWGAIKDAVNVSEEPKHPKVERKSGWLTLAAMGVGAIVVGALVIR